ncbi:MAG: hypothetical protein K2P57_01300 [Burkholderiales bacterium]|nr:hypothetical protein [Burkholderiales bacterium]
MTKDGEEGEKSVLAPVESEWGEAPKDHFGYASDEERLKKRGMEDWELTEYIPKSQKSVPYWFVAVMVAVLLVAVGLSFPFWGGRPGVERHWLDWGYAVALVYISAGIAFVYFMVNHQGPPSDEPDGNTEKQDEKD